MEEDIVHTLLRLDILEGKSSVNLDELSTLLLDNYSKRLGENPANSRYEDSYCPPSPLVDQVAKEMINSFKRYSGLHIHTKDYWGHIHEKNMSTNAHDHIGADVSSVLYVSVPEGSGSIVFKPRPDPSDSGFLSKEFPPKEGTFYMFPSYLEHYVTRNQSDKKRISISFNFKKGIANE